MKLIKTESIKDNCRKMTHSEPLNQIGIGRGKDTTGRMKKLDK